MKLTNRKSKIQNRIGGGVSESNRPKIALTISQTVLKTAPFTGTDAPPKKNVQSNRKFFTKICQVFFNTFAKKSSTGTSCRLEQV